MTKRRDKKEEAEVIEVFTIPRPYHNFRGSTTSISRNDQIQEFSHDNRQSERNSETPSYIGMEKEEFEDYIETSSFLPISECGCDQGCRQTTFIFSIVLSTLGIIGSIIACIILKVSLERFEDVFLRQKQLNVNVSARLQVCDWLSNDVLVHIVSPRYPRPYLPYTKMTYCFEDLIDFCTLKIHFDDIDLSIGENEYFNHKFMNYLINSEIRESSIKFDYLKISKNKFVSGSNFKNKTVYVDISNNTGLIEILFSSNKGGGHGFNITITKEKCQITDDDDLVCPTIVHLDGNSIYTSNNFYPDDLQCSWKLVAPVNSCSLSIQTIWFELEPSPECFLDSVIIANLTLCGFVDDQTFHVPMNFSVTSVEGKFTSDSSVSARGFNISYVWNPC